MSASTRSRAVMLPASCARKSSATASGLRDERRYNSSISRRISFPSTIFTGGMQMPSSKAFSAEPQNEDGVMPLAPGRERKLLRRHIAPVPAVEDGVFHLAHFGHELPLVFPSTLARRGGSEADGVVRPLALHHPPPAADPSSCQEEGKSIRSHRPKVISKLPNASTRSDRPGWTTTVVSVVSI